MKVDFYTSALKQEERDYAANQFGTVVGMLIGLAALVATVGGIGLAGSISIGVVERTREIGVLRGHRRAFADPDGHLRDRGRAAGPDELRRRRCRCRSCWRSHLLA